MSRPKPSRVRRRELTKDWRSLPSPEDQFEVLDSAQRTVSDGLRRAPYTSVVIEELRA
eukprot:CAMPEP_0182940540 /NCGR_PEP_ID=MMETSP0105_2-20130417/47466_1 /TAXON_ID=81532 ORGANISM="Acanthoeca-like sp., Strain 10tr" /NCGR_SAMPLE_ID=MMETSP0105_2 /ASSEMBLY_ACC=CAM_ASM_000205 /LENGTH=57 /DNA_ID=CAMNT_0025080041 /DNA_START=14 /DNA_END=183 /DNA_ORIENTATION=+